MKILVLERTSLDDSNHGAESIAWFSHRFADSHLADVSIEKQRVSASEAAEQLREIMEVWKFLSFRI